MQSIEHQQRKAPRGTRRQHQAGDRTPPHNFDAEESLLGAAMLSPVALEVAVTEVETEDFYKPTHANIHDALCRLWHAGQVKVDPIIVADELASMGLLDAIGGPATLIGIQAMTPATSNAPRYARIVVEHSTLRRLITAGSEIMELGFDVPDNVASVVDQANYLLSQVALPVHTGQASPDLDEFLEAEPETYDWLVAGLLERRDRIIITGGEGGGKSTLLRQLAVCMAAGLHPFRYRPVDPVRVLVVDVENSPGQMRREFRRMREHVGDRLKPGYLRLESRLDGLDLTQRHDSRWLFERVASNRPDVLITGPIYKLHAEDPNDEQSARKVSRVFDMIREKFDCAIILEAHAPHAGEGRSRNLRPFGSSLWLRWPEFGYGMRPDKDAGEVNGHPAAVYWDAWRGPRDQREWPVRLSGDGADFWPWRDSAYRPADGPRGPRALATTPAADEQGRFPDGHDVERF